MKSLLLWTSAVRGFPIPLTGHVYCGVGALFWETVTVALTMVFVLSVSR